MTNFKILLCCTSMLLLVVISKCSGYKKQFKSDNINKYIFDGGKFKFIDLTLCMNKEYGRLSEVEKARVRAVEEYSPNYNNWVNYCEKEWIGTSLDLKHKYDTLFLDEQSDKTSEYYSQQPSIKSLSLEKLIVPLIVADISSKVNGDRHFSLKKHHLDFFLNNYFGNTAQPCIILFKFGWSIHKYDIRRYYGLNHGTNLTSGTPGISEEVAKWISTDYKNVIGIGVDIPSIDPGNTNNVAHNTLVDAGLYVVTNVDLEQYLPDAWCTALVLPQTEQETKAPVRFVAICPTSRMERHEIPLHRL